MTDDELTEAFRQLQEAKPLTSTPRLARIKRILSHVGEQGPCGRALYSLIMSAILEEESNARTRGVEPLDPRKVAIGVMKNMRSAMQTVRDELDGMDGVGKYR